MLRPYRELAAIPHLPGLLLWSMIGRIHLPGTPLAVSFLIAGWTGSYALAGVVGGALTLGMGVAGPLRGRAADRSPAGRLLLVTSSGYGVGIAVLGVLPAVTPSAAWPLAVVVAFLTGLSTPPVTAMSRASFPRLTTGPAVFTVEASMQEVMYIVGPALAATVVAVWNAQVALWLCGALAVFGALGFGGALRRAGLDRPVAREVERGGRTLLRDGSLVLALLTALFMVASLVSIDMVIIGWARDLGRPAMAGVLTAVWGIGSVVGGLIAGGLAGQARFTRRMLLMALGVAPLVLVLPPVLDPSSAWLIGVVLGVGGMAIAPAIAANNQRISGLAPDERKAEAFGWMGTFTTAGSALALPVAGALLDHFGPAAAAGASTTAALVGAVLASRVRDRKAVPVG
ncbi:putative MFS family arabinose efflux permease [Saccharothrix carnea]|uniref:Putative MFS family arabinose efflux permease n=1 Tax=Saccharothrix carnea TaxID=1280637 RepID=A0A2P8I868_SACCR|nr:MFS transporter [Saccharothrix carnea]PSL54666.1 putative MFS family arabinose efflux permease [Saccharothrix carnea]